MSDTKYNIFGFACHFSFSRQRNVFLLRNGARNTMNIFRNIEIYSFLP